MHSEDVMTTARGLAHRKPGRKPGGGNAGSFRNEEEETAEFWEDVEITYRKKQEKSLLKVTFLGGPRPLCLKLFNEKLASTGIRDATFIVLLPVRLQSAPVYS